MVAFANAALDLPTAQKEGEEIKKIYPDSKLFGISTPSSPSDPTCSPMSTPRPGSTQVCRPRRRRTDLHDASRQQVEAIIAEAKKRRLDGPGA